MCMSDIENKLYSHRSLYIPYYLKTEARKSNYGKKNSDVKKLIYLSIFIYKTLFFFVFFLRKKFTKLVFE